jgi:hypothetical protein
MPPHTGLGLAGAIAGVIAVLATPLLSGQRRLRRLVTRQSSGEAAVVPQQELRTPPESRE